MLQNCQTSNKLMLQNCQTSNKHMLQSCQSSNELILRHLIIVPSHNISQVNLAMLNTGCANFVTFEEIRPLSASVGYRLCIFSQFWSMCCLF